MDPVSVVSLVEKLLELVVNLVGGKEKARELLSDDAIARANAAADVVEALRFPNG